jgi:hypothetical protein
MIFKSNLVELFQTSNKMFPLSPLKQYRPPESIVTSMEMHNKLRTAQQRAMIALSRHRLAR